MTRVCYRCKGKRWVGYKAQYACDVCNATGDDPNWRDTRCRYCGSNIEYHINWDRIPEYCNYCKQSQYKGCKGCHTTIEYKRYWDKIPEYCKSCLHDFKHKSCSNPHCNGTVQYKVFWDSVPDYCSCKGYYKKPCKNPKCGQEVNINCKWDRPPDYCKSCMNDWQEKDCASTDCNNKVKY